MSLIVSTIVSYLARVSIGGSFDKNYNFILRDDIITCFYFKNQIDLKNTNVGIRLSNHC